MSGGELSMQGLQYPMFSSVAAPELTHDTNDQSHIMIIENRINQKPITGYTPAVSKI